MFACWVDPAAECDFVACGTLRKFPSQGHSPDGAGAPVLLSGGTTLKTLILSAALALGALGFVSAPAAEAGGPRGRSGLGFRGGYYGGRGFYGQHYRRGGYRPGYGRYPYRNYFGTPYRWGYYKKWHYAPYGHYRPWYGGYYPRAYR